MPNVDPSEVLSNNLDSLKNIKSQLETIQDIKLNVLDFNLRKNNFFKSKTKTSKPIESTLSIKVKKANIKIVNFGLCINIGSDVLAEYLYNKHLVSIKLSFDLKNLCTEQNMLYFISPTNNQSLLTSFKTLDSKLNHIDLKENIDFLKTQIHSNNNFSFFLPIFKSYDNYDDFHDAISNVVFNINYSE
ncbi:hypothetical protein A9Q76_07030 [Arcobacter sp. 31_11_sub10_T18]|nr:hypothetical protein A9Q76_07030 [Arcobacter sp. 31_11_sub10_T18]